MIIFYLYLFKNFICEYVIYITNLIIQEIQIFNFKLYYIYISKLNYVKLV